MIDASARCATALSGAVLAALVDQRWHTSAEIVDDTELLPLAVRVALRDLAGDGWVRRGVEGRWQVTASGMVEAARRKQRAR